MTNVNPSLPSHLTQIAHIFLPAFRAQRRESDSASISRTQTNLMEIINYNVTSLTLPLTSVERCLPRTSNKAATRGNVN
jgi:hypothetical protein